MSNGDSRELDERNNILMKMAQVSVDRLLADAKFCGLTLEESQMLFHGLTECYDKMQRHCLIKMKEQNGS